MLFVLKIQPSSLITLIFKSSKRLANSTSLVITMLFLSTNPKMQESTSPTTLKSTFLAPFKFKDLFETKISPMLLLKTKLCKNLITLELQESASTKILSSNLVIHYL